MVCFGIRDIDDTYSIHAEMMLEKMKADHFPNIFNGSITRFGDLWVVEFTPFLGDFFGYLGGIFASVFLFVWMFSGFSTALFIFVAVFAAILLFRNYIWYYTFKLSAQKKYGAGVLKYVGKETIIKEMLSWDKTKSTTG